MPRLHAETLSIHGPDTMAFAHAQLASNVSSLEPGAWQWSAWLNPQGRVRSLLQVARIDEQHLLLMPRGGTATVLGTELMRYVLRSRVTITAHEPRTLTDAEPLAEHRWHGDGDDMVLGMGDYAMRLGTTSDGTRHWRLASIKAGHPWLPESMLGELLAPALSLRRLGAVSLDKGCYPGQEIVARLHYRGGCKQHLWLIESGTPLVPGTPLASGDETIGHVLDSARDETGTCLALAVLRDPGARSIHAARPEQSEKINAISKL